MTDALLFWGGLVGLAALYIVTSVLVVVLGDGELYKSTKTTTTRHVAYAPVNVDTQENPK